MTKKMARSLSAVDTLRLFVLAIKNTQEGSLDRKEILELAEKFDDSLLPKEKEDEHNKGEGYRED